MAFSHNQLSEHIARLHQISRILSQVTNGKPKEAKIKQEPIVRIEDRRTGKRQDSEYKKASKKGTCIRSGESGRKYLEVETQRSSSEEEEKTSSCNEEKEEEEDSDERRQRAKKPNQRSKQSRIVGVRKVKFGCRKK